MDYMSFNLTYKCDPVCVCVCVCVCACMCDFLLLHIVYICIHTKEGINFPYEVNCKGFYVII